MFISQKTRFLDRVNGFGFGTCSSFSISITLLRAMRGALSASGQLTAFRSLLFATALRTPSAPHFELQQLRYASGGARHKHRVRAPVAILAPECNDFASLGVSPLLLPALDAAGITEPTEVQRAAFDALLREGQDAVLLSETGSGKTLAYALPLVHRLIEEQEALQSEEPTDDNGRSWRPKNQALVLVPNKDLCMQVRGVFDSLLQAIPEERRGRLRVSSLASEVDADADAPILVATPATALKMIRGPEPIRWVILDEADALLAGSFKPAARASYPIEILIADIKRSAKLEAVAKAEAEGKWGLSVRAGPRSGGAKGPEGRALRAQTFYATKQFVLVGATMPNAGTKNMEEHVKRLFPTAEWYRAARVHQSKAEMDHYFVKIDEDSRGAALRQALRHGPQGKALVFANSVPKAEWAYEEAVDELGAGSCALFHKSVPVDERAALLAAYERGELRALICTGLAARGLDFTDVEHVVQFEVATNAVEFMHRVGRTARAGKAGVTTTLYTDSRVDLVEGLRDALVANEPIEHLFSRKRSFKLGIKKRGKRDGTWPAPNGDDDE